MERGPDVIPNAAGGEGGHGAATPHTASGMYLDSPLSLTCLDAGLP
jgi:hypothetical protein